MPENRPVNGRLDSWKEIATYLNRDVRTVIRWEKKGLPVHRVPGGQRQAIFAYKHELDAWLVSQDEGVAAPNSFPKQTERSGTNGFEQVSGSTPEPMPQTLVAQAVRSWKWIVFALVCVTGVVWGINALVKRSHPSATARTVSLRPLTDDGYGKSALRTDGATLYFNEVVGLRILLMSAPVSGSPIRPVETPFANAFLQDLSHDGETLLVTAVEGLTHEGSLWTIPAQGGKPTRVGDVECGEARWSPDNRRIACAVMTRIMVMDADGSNLRTVGTFPSPVLQVTWTPDGTRLRFTQYDIVSHTYSPWEVAISTGGGVAAKPAPGLPLDGTCCVDWAWMPDGKSFEYVTVAADGKTHLMMQAAGSARATEIQVKIGGLFGLAAARTGNFLILQIGNGFRGELLKYDTKHDNFLIFLHGISALYLSFSPDGQWITYTSTMDKSLWRSRADGSEAMQLTTTPMEAELSAWSPDGRQIAFMGRQPGKPFRIYLIGRDGGVPEEVSDGNDNQGAPSWSPDGKELIYGNVLTEATQDGWIRRIRLATHKVEIVPGSHSLRTARWSPDGKYIAALRWRTRELMLFDLRTGVWRVLADDITGDNISWSSDSQFVYVDSPRQERPVVVRVRIRDSQRETVVSLASLQKMTGQIQWLGVTPDNSPILLHLYTASEVYALEWTDQ